MSNKFEQPLVPPPEKPEAEENKELLEQMAPGEVREIRIRRKNEKSEEAVEKQPGKEPRISAEKKKSHPSKKAKKSEITEISPESETEEERRPYSKEEWLEVVERLKEQAAVQYEKEKIEETEEIVELTREMTVAEEKPEKRIFNLYKQIREARRELAESKVEWKSKGGDFEKYQKNQETEKTYKELQRQLLENFLTKAEKRWGRDSEKFVEFRNHLISKGFAGREYERLEKAEKEAEPQKEKGRFKKLYEKVLINTAKLPRSVRWGISAFLGTAVAFGTGGVAAPALLGYAGFRYGRAALGSISAIGAGAGIDALKEIWLKKHGKEAREEKIKSEIEKEAKAINDFAQLSYYMLEKSDERNKELAKLAHRQKLWKVGKMAAMIGAGGGIAFWAGSIDAFTNETGVKNAIQEHLGIKEGAKPIISPPEETSAIKVGPEVAPSTLAAEQFIETVKPGDSVWRLVERHLEQHGYFKSLTGSPEEIAAKKTYLIDWVKDRIAEEPEKFGLTDPDKLAVGQKINLGEILIEDKETLKINEEFLQEIERAENLSLAEIKNINYNNELISQWVKNNPGESLTSGKVAEILGGKRLEILTSNEEELIADWEDYVDNASPEQKEVDLAAWEDYTHLPALNEEEMQDLYDYYDARGNEAVKEFYSDSLRLYNDIMEILAPINMRPAEYLAIKNVTVGKLLEETAGGWEKWRSDEAITIDLPHDGVYGAGEYGRQLKLAEFIKNNNPTGFDKSLTIEEYLKKFVKK